MLHFTLELSVIIMTSVYYRQDIIELITLSDVRVIVRVFNRQFEPHHFVYIINSALKKVGEFEIFTFQRLGLESI